LDCFAVDDAEQDRDRDHQEDAESGAQPVEGPGRVVDGELHRYPTRSVNAACSIMFSFAFAFAFDA
jgi:hypothetical protein